jgi:hypothetical protein
MDLTYCCACCGEENEVFLERSIADRQQFVEDCAICCRPMVITARWNPDTGSFDLEIHQEGRY